MIDLLNYQCFKIGFFVLSIRPNSGLACSLFVYCQNTHSDEFFNSVVESSLANWPILFRSTNYMFAIADLSTDTWVGICVCVRGKPTGNNYFGNTCNQLYQYCNYSSTHTRQSKSNKIRANNERRRLIRLCIFVSLCQGGTNTRIPQIRLSFCLYMHFASAGVNWDWDFDWG